MAKIEYEQWVFEPAADITAYDLALIMKNVGGAYGLTGIVLVYPSKPIPPQLALHFRKIV